MTGRQADKQADIRPAGRQIEGQTKICKDGEMAGRHTGRQADSRWLVGRQAGR